MSKERRLGRGLEALLGRNYAAAATTPLEGFESPAETPVEGAPVASNGDVTRSADGQQWMVLASIDRNPYQPRQTFDEADIADLCDSIRTHGFLQPIVVRPYEGRYQLIAGERRLRAAQMAGWERVPVQIRDVPEQQMAELAIVENVQRKDLNAIEKAVSFKRYLDQYGCTQEELSSRVNIDRSTIANLLRLLDLPEEVKQMIVRGDLTAGHARALLPLGDEEEQKAFARRIQKEVMSVRATEQAVSDHIRRADAEPLSIVDVDGTTRPSPLQPGQHIRDLESQLGLSLGTRVDVKQSAKGRGRLIIHFASHEEFDRLRSILTEKPAPQTGTI